MVDDLVDLNKKATRTKIMRANRSRNTGPEIFVRRALFSRGLRFRLHGKNLPGSPDVVLKKYMTVVFIHGCFWHGHNCHRNPKSKSNNKYWENKIISNRNRDKDSCIRLQQMGWRVLIIWECAIRRQNKNFEGAYISDKLIAWIVNGSSNEAILSENGFEE